MGGKTPNKTEYSAGTWKKEGASRRNGDPAILTLGNLGKPQRSTEGDMKRPPEGIKKKKRGKGRTRCIRARVEKEREKTKRGKERESSEVEAAPQDIRSGGIKKGWGRKKGEGKGEKNGSPSRE